MMVKRQSIWWVILIIFFCHPLAWGGAYEAFGPGIRALSMGGAFIGKADDATATYWNPAGLAQLKGKGIDMDLENDNINFRVRPSIRNPSPTDASAIRGDVFIRHLNTEPERFQEDKPDFFYVMADMAGYYHWEGFTFGGSFYVPNGQYVDWKDRIVTPSGEAIAAKFFSSFLLSVTNLSVAREIFPGVMLGGGIDFVTGYFTQDINKYLVGSKIPEQDYAFGIDATGLGYGLEGIFGLLLKPTDWFSIGAVYRTGANVNVNGHLHILQTPVPGSVAGVDAASDYKQDFPLPPTWGMGIAIKPFPKLTFTIDAQGTDWTVMKTEIDYENQRRGGFPLPNINQKVHYNVSWHYRAGVEYKINQRWTVMGGYMYDENPVPDSSSSLTTINGLIFNLISFGITYDWGKWKVSFHANTHNYYERVEHQSISGRDFLWGIGLSYRF